MKDSKLRAAPLRSMRKIATVSEIMTPDPLNVSPETSLDRAIVLMDDNRVRHLPVLDRGELVGILSDRDLLAATGWLRSGAHACRGTEVFFRMPHRVGEIMETTVGRIESDDTLMRAAIEMLERAIGCLLVVRQGRLVGILTEMDFVAAYVRGAIDPVADDSRCVADQMTPAPTAIHWFTTLEDATSICQRDGVRHLPVLEAEQLVGILSDRDLRRAVGLGRSGSTPVEDFVSREPVTVPPTMPLRDAAALMVKRKFSALPVLDGDDLLGILTLTDVLEVCFGACRDAKDAASA